MKECIGYLFWKDNVFQYNSENKENQTVNPDLAIKLLLDFRLTLYCSSDTAE